MNLGASVEMGQRLSDGGPKFTLERALELKARARALFVQGLEYTSCDDADTRTLTRGKPVWE